MEGCGDHLSERTSSASASSHSRLGVGPAGEGGIPRAPPQTAGGPAKGDGSMDIRYNVEGQGFNIAL